MNNFFGLSPDAHSTPNELRLMLNGFGPHAGRYIITYPNTSSWKHRIREKFSEVGDLQRKRIVDTLMQAELNSSILDAKLFPSAPKATWNDSFSWAQNALPVLSAIKEIRTTYLSDDEYQNITANDSTLKRYVTPASEVCLATTDKSFEPSTENYWSISRILCSLSHEIHFIDPYFIPKDRYRLPIFSKFLTELSQLKKIQSVIFWARIPERSDSELTAILNRNIRKATTNCTKRLSITFNFVKDAASKDKLHARYLLSDKGCIKFDHGFQLLPQGRTNIASVVSSDYASELFRVFSRKELDFSIADCVEFITQPSNRRP